MMKINILGATIDSEIFDYMVRYNEAIVIQTALKEELDEINSTIRKLVEKLLSFPEVKFSEDTKSTSTITKKEYKPIPVVDKEVIKDEKEDHPSSKQYITDTNHLYNILLKEKKPNYKEDKFIQRMKKLFFELDTESIANYWIREKGINLSKSTLMKYISKIRALVSYNQDPKSNLPDKFLNLFINDLYEMLDYFNI